MIRFVIPVLLVVVFLGWVLYRLLVKRDLKQHMNELYAGVFFFAVWAAVYAFMFR